MSDSQWYPQHLSLIINLEEISLFFLFKNDLILTVFFSEHKCASQFKRNKMSPKITSIVPLKRLYVECKRYFTRPYNYNIVMPSCLMQHGTLYHLYQQKRMKLTMLFFLQIIYFQLRFLYKLGRLLGRFVPIFYFICKHEVLLLNK